MSDPVESMYRAVEWIEAHLQSEINIAQAADAVDYSLFHFIRTFDRAVHHTPYDYLVRRRLTEAARALCSSDRRIIDIAQDFCFNNHETFTRAFKRMFGVQPSEWREKKLAACTMLMPRKTLADLRFIHQESFRYPVVMEFPERPFCGLMTSLDADDQLQQDQRSRAIADLRDLLGDFLPHRVVGVTFYLNQNRRSAYFFAGVEKDAWKPGLPRLAIYTLPEGKYVQMPAASTDRRLALDYIYFTWFPRVRLKPAGNIEVEWIEAVAPEGITISIPIYNSTDKFN